MDGKGQRCTVNRYRHRLKLAYYDLKHYELEIYDLIVAKVALKVCRYRGKKLFTYHLLTKLKIPYSGKLKFTEKVLVTF